MDEYPRPELEEIKETPEEIKERERREHELYIIRKRILEDLERKKSN